MALDDFSGFATPMSPGQSGVGGFVAPTADDPYTSTSQTGNAGSSFNATDLAAALKNLKEGLPAQNQSSAASQAGTMAPAGSAQSGTGQGSPAALNALVQMLMQRQNAYFPGQPNRRPVALPRPGGGSGLLGL